MSLDAPELADGMLPTHYTREALPPPAPEMQAFLDQLKKDAEKIRTLQTGVKSADILRNDDRVTPVDKGKPALNPIDPGKPSINFT